jgi:uncharacterized protein
MKKEQIIAFLKTNKHYLRSKYHISKLGLIGSFARDEEHEGSDIDLLIEFEAGTSNIYDIKYDLREYLKSHFNKEIDLCREKYIKPQYKEYILKDIIYV